MQNPLLTVLKFLKKTWSQIMGAFPAGVLILLNSNNHKPKKHLPPPPPPKAKPKLLFLVKQRQVGPYSYSHGASGLYNSARFVVMMLAKEDFAVDIVTCVDGNSIDKEVHDRRPDIVFVEAYWVTPAKFAELQKLHPKVKFVVRNHSKPPFLATEGVAFKWTLEYLRQGVAVAFNSWEATAAFDALARIHGLSANDVICLPNYYAFDDFEAPRGKKPGFIDVGCFGAIRPLKNHVNQAFAALRVAADKNETLRFHVNATRIEGNGADNVLKSLRAMFEGSPHTLVEHPWLDHADFLLLMQKMNACMQVSYTETFNVVSADAVVMNVPVVRSPEIDWLRGFPEADPNDIDSIVASLNDALTTNNEARHASLRKQRESLTAFNESSADIWYDWLTG